MFSDTIIISKLSLAGRTYRAWLRSCYAESLSGGTKSGPGSQSFIQSIGPRLPHHVLVFVILELHLDWQPPALPSSLSQFSQSKLESVNWNSDLVDKVQWSLIVVLSQPPGLSSSLPSHSSPHWISTAAAKTAAAVAQISTLVDISLYMHVDFFSLEKV